MTRLDLEPTLPRRLLDRGELGGEEARSSVVLASRRVLAQPARRAQLHFFQPDPLVKVMRRAEAPRARGSVARRGAPTGTKRPARRPGPGGDSPDAGGRDPKTADLGGDQHRCRGHPRPPRTAPQRRDHTGRPDPLWDQLLPDYPQGLLKLGRFRGTSVTGDILDNRQEHLHAFAAVHEAMAFLDRTLPLVAHFPTGQIFREDRLPVPVEAMREILLNAVMHRDYSDPGSYVAVAVFDDRIEVRSIGRLPPGVTAAMLSGPHLSKLRNPLIAETFHRTGAVEIWGRGTNRVIEACQRYGLEPPTFEEQAGGLVVTFRAPIGPGPAMGPSRDQVGTRSGPSRDQVGTMSTLSEEQTSVVAAAAKDAQSMLSLMERCGRTNRSKFRQQVLKPLIDAGLLEMTIPDKPTSSRQRYRTTASGARLLRGS